MTEQDSDLQIFPLLQIRLGAAPFNLLQALSFPPGADLEGINQAEFQEFFIQSRHNLQSLSKKEFLQKAIPLSSHSFWQRFQDYQHKKIADLRKKERQTELRLLAYCARALAKTSPFSFLGPVGFFNMNTSGIISVQVSSFVTLNQKLHLILRSLLSAFPPYFRWQKLHLNPALWKKGAKIKFLSNRDNLEAVSEISAGPALDLLWSKCQDPIPFSELIGHLMQETDQSEAEWENYLLSLVRMDLLQWVWPVNLGTWDWDQSFLSHIAPQREISELRHLRDLLERTVQVKSSFKDSSSENRIRLQRELLSAWQDFQDYISTQSPQHFEKFSIPAEKLLYEDCPVEHHFTRSDLLGSELDLLKNCLALSASLDPSPVQQQLQEFFRSKFPHRQQLGFLEFYESFFKSGQQLKFANKNFPPKQPFIFDKNCIQEGVFYLKREQLDAFQKKAKRADGYGILVQLARLGPGKEALIVNGICSGYGNLFGRFVPAFFPELSEEIMEWNRAHHSKCKIYENSDSSPLNVSINPPIYEQMKLPNLSRLSVAWTEDGEALELVEEPVRETLKVLDFSLSGIEWRSPSFQLLDALSQSRPSLRALLHYLNCSLVSKVNGVRFYPRIVVGERLILQRKRWIVEKGEIPVKKQKTELYIYFQHLQAWRMKWGFPRRVFVRLHFPKELDRSVHRTRHKPQYMDFGSPLFVLLFIKILRKVDYALVLEEMLPAPEHFPNQDGPTQVYELGLLFR